jgi:hypothetical protein
MNDQTTSPANPRALPELWVDRLFARLAGLYGRHWLDMWADVPMADVKDAWRDALGNASGYAIRQALDHLAKHNKFPPSAPEFAALCANFHVPTTSTPTLPLEAPTQAERAIAARITQWSSASMPADGRKWARDILALHAKGLYRMPGSIYGLKCAKAVLGLVAD